MTNYETWRKEFLDKGCTKCPALCKNRTQIVVDRSSLIRSINSPDIVFIGEAPGSSEDRSGQAFVGRSGQYLDRLIKKMGVKNYLITNVVKCKPPGNRTPTREEIKNCRDYLKEQLDILRPRIIVSLGRVACEWFFSQAQWGWTTMKDFVTTEEKLMWRNSHFYPFYHPAFILRNSHLKGWFTRLENRLVKQIREVLGEVEKR